VARAFSLPALRLKLVYESHEYDPVEPISRNTGANNDVGGGKGQRDEKQEWDAWGDWDVDSSDPASGSDAEETPTNSVTEDVGGSDQQPLFVVRDGQRFKKREAEILDGMRPWGDFLDLEGSPWSAVGTAGGGTGRHLRGVRVRVEPLMKDRK
jgi:hypothetical protein